MYCSCCDHNVEIMSIGDGRTEHNTKKRSIQDWFMPLGRNKDGKTYLNPPSTNSVVGKGRYRQHTRKYSCIGRKTGRDIQRSLKIPGAAHAICIVDENQCEQDFPAQTALELTPADAQKSAVRQILNAIFSDIVDSDRNLEAETNITTQCFLVHLSHDIDQNGSFLSQYDHLPPRAANMDLDTGLSFVSTWLQASLCRIKTGYAHGEAELQMPFCVLETDYAAATARATALQRLHSEEKVAIATLDIMALKSSKLVALAKHTFDFLRVPIGNLALGDSLLAWAESSHDGRSAQALRDAVLAVVEWKGESGGMAAEDVGLIGSLDGEGAAVQGDRLERPKKDSVVTDCTVSEASSKTAILNQGGPSALGQ